MSGIPFHRTQMGYAFITKTVPGAVREIKRLADGIEKLSGILEEHRRPMDLALSRPHPWPEQRFDARTRGKSPMR